MVFNATLVLFAVIARPGTTIDSAVANTPLLKDRLRRTADMDRAALGTGMTF